MSGPPQGYPRPPGQGGQPPPHPSHNAYPPPMNYPMPGPYPPPGQPGLGPPPPGQPGLGPPPPGQPGLGPLPPGQPGLGPPPPGQPARFGPPPPGSIPPGYGAPPGTMPPYGMPPPPYSNMPPPGGAYPLPSGGAPGYGAPYGAPHGGPPYGYPGGHPGGYPGHPPGVQHSTGNDSDDSQPGDPGLRSKGSSKKIKCTFVNHADTKVLLCTIDEKGKTHKVCKLKEDKKEVIETFEGNVFFARSKKKKKKKKGRTLVINNNFLYAVAAEDHGNNNVKAEILQGPDCVKDLESEKDNIDKVAVKVKFINRSKKSAQLVWMNPRGKRENKKVVAPGKCYTTTSYECHFWIAHDVQNQDDEMFLNYAFFYSPWKTKKEKERVLITQHKPWRDSSSSSSSSSD